MLAVTTKELTIHGVTIPKDTTIVIDSYDMIAFWNGLHFTIDYSEFILIN